MVVDFSPCEERQIGNEPVTINRSASCQEVAPGGDSFAVSAGEGPPNRQMISSS